MRRGRRIRIGLALAAILLSLPSGNAALWAKDGKRSNPSLWIVADRIVGFVPFTVYLYGKVSGVEPGRIEMCRTEVAWLTETSATRLGGSQATSLDARQTTDPATEPSCAPGRVARTPDGYDYAHAMRFDRPGTYQVRLRMIDGKRGTVVSNTLQVNAF
ncbi:MAG TPA: hypothetical protein VNL37_04370 [Candidatus Polarisedimenticolia bacterium]|nr:hypothetical protein [Candidatus Polarisedimenticolia bacterium]